jgi:hypothetical protein
MSIPYLNFKQKKSWGILDLGFNGVNDPAETDFDDFRSDYLGEYEAICETALARESGPWVGLIDEKNTRVENLVQLSL